MPPPAPERVSDSVLRVAGKAPPLRLRSIGARHGLVMAAAMILAGGLDYCVNVLAGRRLEPEEFGTFVSVSALLQVMLLLSIAIRMVVAFYAAELSGRAQPADRVGAFVRSAWGWAWRWGLAGSVLMAASSPLLARALRLPSVWPVVAASAMVLMLFMRETTYGALQGIQAFEPLGFVQVAQATLRMLLVAGLIGAGWGAAGAILAQPLACIGGLAIAAWSLRPLLRGRGAHAALPVNWHYSVYTLVGLAAFGLLTNIDALFVKRFFSPAVAGNYGPVVTLAKICLFLPWAVGFVLFPKVANRRVAGIDPRPILLLALAAALAPGLLVTALCFLRPGPLVATIFGPGYSDPGVVLGLATLAATLHAGVHIWLNYALSLERKQFAYVLVAILSVQAIGMVLLGRDSLLNMTLVMVSSGLVANLAGYLATTSGVTVATPARRAGVADGG